jgi:3-oxo-5-alpha-steroid 4-dehydrogenase 1
MTIESLKFAGYVWIALALAVFVTMFFITAPFGRHTTTKWGISIDNKWGWFIMELPSLIIMLYFLIWGTHTFSSCVWILFACWILHYFNRTVIYPLRIRPTPKRMPVVIMSSAILFNLVNAGLNGYYLAELAPVSDYGENWLTRPHFIIGFVLFATGMWINLKSDNMLIRLRSQGETGYRIPQGFLFKFVSAPNLFGEIVEWTGFALMAWNLPAFTFMAWTFANLVPRAKNHHDWYRRNFDNYPKDRKAVFPFVY